MIDGQVLRIDGQIPHHSQSYSPFVQNKCDSVVPFFPDADPIIAIETPIIHNYPSSGRRGAKQRRCIFQGRAARFLLVDKVGGVSAKWELN